ncbi:hypothetical protein [Paraburkholderia sediminicola]|uniref:hypothetical protein n=1 Tax=Paraburkholderia sediminicola TaxID=458836 RepID=UPI0038BDDC5E
MDEARNHVEERRQKGDALDKMVCEYRTLRAGIVRQWTEEMAGVDRNALDELVRFNDSVCQGAAGSV